MVKMLLLFLFLCVFLPDKTDGYLTLIRLEVCSVVFDVDSSVDVFDSVTFDVASDDSFSFSSGSNEDDPYFEYDSEDSEKLCQFVAPNVGVYGDIILSIKEKSKQAAFLSYLWEHSVDNDLNSGVCDCLGSFNLPNDGADDIQWDVTPNVDQSLDSNHQVEVRLCSRWDDFSEDQPDEDAARMLMWSKETMAGDTWSCNNFHCETVEDIVEAEYYGFEVFTDSNCDEMTRTNDGDWRCKSCNKETNYRRYRKDGEITGNRKCFNCQELFGDSCVACNSEGCKECTSNATDYGFAIRYKDGNCGYNYCGDRCCEGEGETFPPETTKDCELEEPRGGGQGSTDYNCDTDEMRYDNAQELSPPGPYGDRYRLPDPVISDLDNKDCDQDDPTYAARCLGDCNNNLGYLCNSNTDPDCVECNGFEKNNRGCKVCKCSVDDDDDSCPDSSEDSAEDEYFWYSNAVPCAPCSDFEDCVSCKNGGDYGGGGCARCDPDSSTVLKYDEMYGVWYCAESDDVWGFETTKVPPGDDGWDGLECITRCEDRRGGSDHCACGCDCTDCVIKDAGHPSEPANNTAPYYCIDCHFHAGCDQCYNDNTNSENDYFMVDKDYPCVNCAETFGTRCLFCNDYVGCAQCRPGYILTFSECCKLFYCEALFTHDE